MVTWEYCQLEAGNRFVAYYAPTGTRVESFGNERWEIVLARLGAEGWELVHTFQRNGTVYVMKRPLAS